MNTSKILADLVLAAGCETPVLITHPDERSREVYARFIHDHSLLRKDPFIAIFCGGGPDTGPMPALLRATCKRICRGTLFLDRINALDEPTQAELSALLGDATAHAPASSARFPSALRLIAGSREALRPMVEAGRFSAALFSRFAVIQITHNVPASGDIEAPSRPLGRPGADEAGPTPDTQ